MSTTSSGKMPSGIPYIIGNEAAERFSFYGMKAILSVFMTQYLLNKYGEEDFMSESEASIWFHLFIIATYLTPILGALLSDIFLGKYKTIMTLSIVYCLGHLALALDETRLGLTIGLTLIAIGSGGIKPCVSAHVGDQFTKGNQHLLDKIFSYFYFSINLGAMVASLLTPVLLKAYGPHIAFGIPGLLMLLATIVFYIGRKDFIAIKPAGWETYKKDLLSKDGKRVLKNLAVIYFLFISIFWSLFDQTGSTWIFQAIRMDKLINLGFFQFELLPSQIQAVNPFLILAGIPLFTFVIYPFVGRFVNVTAIRKISVGMFLAVLPFVICAFVEQSLMNGGSPSIFWQFLAYLLLTIAEILVSISALEFAYTQAPNTMKSFLLGFYLISVALGNAVTAIVNAVIMSSIVSFSIFSGDVTTISMEDVSVFSENQKISLSSASGILNDEGKTLQGTFFVSEINKENQTFLLKDASGAYVSSTGTLDDVHSSKIVYSKLKGASYFWFFALLMLLAAILFIPVASKYKEKTFVQSEEDVE